MQLNPIIVEDNIFSPSIKRIGISDINGAKNIKLLTFAVVFESFKALSQSTKVIPISNEPT